MAETTTTTSVENWKPVASYEIVYEISDKGRLRTTYILGSLNKEVFNKTPKPPRILKNTNHKQGYHTGALSIAGQRYGYKAHRLVALAFVPNPDKKPYVNHKNGKKKDNRPENLEWVTHQENIIHALRVLGVRMSYPRQRPVQAINSKKILSFNSIKSACANGFEKSCIHACLKNKEKRHRGYKWRYA